MELEGSGSTLFSVDGTVGRLFEVVDSLSGSIFSANTIGGVPVIEAFSDNTVTLGSFANKDFVITQSLVGISTDTPAYPLHVSASVSGDSIYAIGDIIASSDERTKTEIEIIEDAIEKVKAIRGVTYKKLDLDTDKRKMGVIAQEVQKVAPEVVSEDDRGYLSVAYGNLTALLIEAVKDQQKQIDSLKADIDKLKNK